MSNYSKATDFAAKDTLLSGDPDKIVKGTPLDDEFNAIAVASASKADTASPTFTGTVSCNGTINFTSATISFAGSTVSDAGTVTTIDINGGTIDAAVIGSVSKAAGTFTTMTADTAVIAAGSFVGAVTMTSGTVAGATEVESDKFTLDMGSDGVYLGDTQSGTTQFWRASNFNGGFLLETAPTQGGTYASAWLLDASGNQTVYGTSNFTDDVTGVVRGSAITGNNGAFEAVTALPGSPDADTIYFVI